jgi:ppGpp synthetase/RelA/SpoT-type nucleotidyltranferase
MKWITRQYSKSRIDRAGEALFRDLSAVSDDEMSTAIEESIDALEIVNNWRSCHAFPLNTMQIGLRRLARQVDARPLVAQRIKRLSSIRLKLKRFPTMTLSQMQDLGGCRAIVTESAAVLKLAELYRQSRIKHKLHTLDNYIECPQASGYRGVHLIYQYNSDRSETFNGQKIEIQLRSALQHSWATAVETVGFFTRHALKSSIGPAQWLRFFQLMGSVVAIKEGTNRVDGTPEDVAQLVAELRGISTDLDVINRLTGFGAALTHVSNSTGGGAHYFLVQLDLDLHRTTVTGFTPNQLGLANEQYLAAERNVSEGKDAVLVSVENLAVLQRAYPNYFLDTRMFLHTLAEALEHKRLRRRRKPAVLKHRRRRSRP